jgi:calcium-dependent protein kinase
MILKELDHPNILKIYEFFQNNDYYFIVTEYCLGGELFDYIVD